MSQESSCMALFNCRKIQEKYIRFMRSYSGAGTKPVGKTGPDYRITGNEFDLIVKEYGEKVPLSEIAIKYKRSCCSVRRALKKAGVYELYRESPANKWKGYTPTKTVRVDKL